MSANGLEARIEIFIKRDGKVFTGPRPGSQETERVVFDGKQLSLVPTTLMFTSANPNMDEFKILARDLYGEAPLGTTVHYKALIEEKTDYSGSINYLG